MIDSAPLAVGTRVRLRSASHLVDLRSPTGAIVRPDEWDGYYIVRLDEPAVYHDPNGSARELPEIAEAIDNLERASDGLSSFLDQQYENMGFSELADAPIDALQGLSKGDAEALKKALGARTIRELAENKFIRAAQAITLLANAK